MALFNGPIRRLRALFRQSQIDRDLAEEMRLHMELREAQLRRDGLSDDASRQAARRRFGSPLRLREEGLDSWGWRWVEQLLQDLRFATRTLVAHPAYALTAIVTLGLGIGANTAMFSVLDGVVLKPLPYGNGDRLLVVRQSAPGLGVANAGVSVREYYDYRDRLQSFDALVEYHQMFFDLLRRGAPDRVDVGVVSHDFFAVMGIEPLLGRSFTAADDAQGADAVLLLSYSYWINKFGGDPRIVGQVFEMNDRPHKVVGVLPEVPHYPQENDVYMPVASCPFRAQAEPASVTNRRAFQLLSIFGRLKPGVTQDAAAREVDVVCNGLIAAHPAVYPPATGFAAAARSVRSALARDAEPLLLILIAATALVLLIACANVANLTIARLLRRDRELGVREALGAGRGRLVRQLLTESALLSLIGGGVGLLLAASTLSMLTMFVSRFTSRVGEIAIDGRVLAFTIAASVLTGMLSGIVPMLASRFDLGAMLRGGGSAEGPVRRRVQKALVIAQVAVSVVLLAGAGVLMASFYRLQQVPLGFESERVVSAEAFVTFSRHSTRDQHLGLYQSIIDRLEQEPGVVSAAVTSAAPLSTDEPNFARFRIEGHDRPAGTLSTIDVAVVSANYFATLGIPLVQGRAFTDDDGADAAPVAIINETMRAQWAGDSPIGRRISIDNGRSWWRTVVGVAGDIRQNTIDTATRPMLYVPLGQGPAIDGQILVRTSLDAAAAATLITDAVHEVDSDLPVENIASLAARRTQYLSRPLITAVLVTIFAALALAVTMTGVGGVVALHVSHRLKEFGVRMALGARPGQVLRPVLCDGLCLVGGGVVIGLGAAFVLTRVLSPHLFATTPTDPLTFTVVTLALLATGTLACLGPAWRATRVDAGIVFRTD